MTHIQGQHLLTIRAEAGETYEIDCGSGFVANIINNTDGTLIVSEHSDYSDNGTVANCLILEGGAFYNRLRLQHGNLYLTPAEAGNIMVVNVA